jgi:hypothetical protein
MKVKIPAEQALKLFWEKEEPNAPSQHPAKTKQCPTYGQFDSHVMRTAKLTNAQLKHTNQCDYCQLSLFLFRKHLGQVRPARRIVAWAAMSPVLTDAPVTAPTVVDVPDQEKPKELPVVMLHSLHLSPDNHLGMWVSVQGLKISDDKLPIQMDLEFQPEQDKAKVLQTFDLPELGKQWLTVNLPPDVLDHKCWKALKEQRVMPPIGFVLRW